ncbi:MAG TPA: hypothetical protein VFQ00_12245 [Terriglobales bacterium]|nr:hypothetical protein [Terriglobales bacterium]
MPTHEAPNTKAAHASRTLSAKQKFALDTIRSAVALPQTDAQDRLRVLAASAELAAPLDPALSKKLVADGAQEELTIIENGDTPAVSIFSSGKADCSAAADFIASVPDESVSRAEPSIVGAVTHCPQQTLDRARLLLSSAVDQHVLAAQAIQAAITASGPKTEWSQQMFDKFFGSLPKDSKAAQSQAPLFAQFYASMAEQVDKSSASTAGLKLLDWLATLDESGTRNNAITTATGALQTALGPEDYGKAISSDIVAQTMTQVSGQNNEIEMPEEENVSVMQASAHRGPNAVEDLNKLPPSLRAREAAAQGFSAGQEGDHSAANQDFDIAYSALNDVWNDRSPKQDVSSIVEEVNEAAAHVDPISAMRRAQKLDDPAAQAIAMLAVARVVETGQETSPQPRVVTRSRQVNPSM